MNKMVLWTAWLKAKTGSERGAGMAEYALLLFVVAVAATATVTIFGDDIIAVFTEATDTLPNGAGAP